MSLRSKPLAGNARNKLFMLLRQAARHVSRARCQAIRSSLRSKPFTASMYKQKTRRFVAGGPGLFM